MCGRTRMRNVIFSMGVSLDGHIAGPGGEFDWSAPDDELHRFHNKQTRELGAHLCGRRLYEAMVYRERPDDSRGGPEREFARFWQSLPKIVFSQHARCGRGQRSAGRRRPRRGARPARGRHRRGRCRACRDPHRARPHRRVPGVRQPGDRGRGNGTPFFPAVDHRIDLELVERRTFGSRVTSATAALTHTPRAGAATVDGRDSAREANATGRKAAIPGTPHFPTQEKPALVNAIVLDFLTNDPVLTFAAIRRAPADQTG